MKRALITAGAVLIFAAPALADSWTIEKETTTTSSSSVVPLTNPAPAVVVEQPPPPARTELPPPPPDADAAWVAGHWRWDTANQTYVWLHGHYVQPPEFGVAWVPGHWDRRADGWAWVYGHWH
jgi:hypothetical protein